MSIFIENLLTMFSYMMIAIFVQNIIFTRGFGASRLINLVGDSGVSSVLFCGALTLTLVLNAPLTYFINHYLANERFWYRNYVRPFAYTLSIALVAALLIIIVSLTKLPRAKEIIAVLPMACFNCAVLGPLLISSSQSYTLVQTIGFALGSGLGYGFAALILSEGQRKLNARRIPATFRGLPIMLIYIGILALAIYGLTGHRLVV